MVLTEPWRLWAGSNGVVRRGLGQGFAVGQRGAVIVDMMHSKGALSKVHYSWNIVKGRQRAFDQALAKYRWSKRLGLCSDCTRMASGSAVGVVSCRAVQHAISSRELATLVRTCTGGKGRSTIA
jgi:hypothetical protein